MMGRPGSGRARKASISFPRSATTNQLSSFRDTRLRADLESRDYSARFRVRADARPGMRVRSGAGDEVRRQPGLDVLRDFLGGTILGVPEGARARETLVAAGDVVGDTRERTAGHDRFVGSDLDQIVLRIDADVLAGG